MLALALLVPHLAGQSRPQRSRDLGIPLEGTTGPLNAITDVPGVTVGHATVIRGSGPLRVGEGPVRTGVTAIFPRGRGDLEPVFAGWFSLNGNGEMTGTAWLDDHEHQQRGSGAGCRHRVGTHPGPGSIQLLSAGRSRDLGRRPQ
jgi:D-aminopeptidase